MCHPGSETIKSDRRRSNQIGDDQIGSETIDSEKRVVMAILNEELSNVIAAVKQNYMDTFLRKDAEGIGKHYTDSGRLIPAKGDLVKGTEAIQAYWQAFMDMGIKPAKLETVELEGSGDTAVEVGRYILGGEGGQVFDKGKYMAIWKQEGVQWKLHREIWNSTMPAAEK